MEPKITDFKQDVSNARILTEEGKKLLHDSIQTSGLGRSILVDKNGNIIAGNKTHEAAIEEGIQEVVVVKTSGDKLVVVQRDDLDLYQDEKARMLAFFDNRSSDLAEWSPEQLIADINAGFDIKSLFDDKAMTDIMREIEAEKVRSEPPPPAPDIEETTITNYDVQPGQIWQIGPHRVACGDSTDPDTIHALTQDAPILTFTSPPYDKQRTYDSNLNQDWLSMMQGVFTAHPHNDQTQLLVNLGIHYQDGNWQEYWRDWVDWMSDSGWRKFGWYVWYQMEGIPGSGGGRLSPSHEFIFHFNRSTRLPNKIVPCKHAGQIVGNTNALGSAGNSGGYGAAGLPVSDFKIPESVIQAPRAKGGVAGHPAPFSIPLASTIISTYSNVGDLIYDPFLGSGTTLLAANSLSRICYGCEISPKYVTIILQRAEQSGLPVEVK